MNKDNKNQRIISLLEVFALSALLCIVLGCASHKENVCGITEEYADSLYQATAHISQSTNHNCDSTASANIIAITDSNNTVTLKDRDEVINEHIVETIDSAGNKTITTDRTIKRASHDRQSNNRISTSSQSTTQTNKNTSQNNLVSADNSRQLQSHHAKSDSINITNVAEENKRSWWDKFVDNIKYLLMAVLMAMIFTFMYKYIKGT